MQTGATIKLSRDPSNILFDRSIITRPSCFFVRTNGARFEGFTIYTKISSLQEGLLFYFSYRFPVQPRHRGHRIQVSVANLSWNHGESRRGARECRLKYNRERRSSGRKNSTPDRIVHLHSFSSRSVIPTPTLTYFSRVNLPRTLLRGTPFAA